MYKETLFVERMGKTTVDISYFAGNYKGFSMALFMLKEFISHLNTIQLCTER
ncbi:hypothetical protein SAMN05216490_4969 [Mucilaginibacter mallensis]|uniref:Uncharacterized protein n=1 Tax=Mucilaginibacter mallensis TaxID=652787 RepID=A0A1H2CEQ5_MUCMA|nr:hypothetical protein SAMN05216490_4969 [Mucilaginibacter mallensis]